MPVNRLFQQILSAIVTVDFSINWWKLYLVSVFVFAIRTNFHLICRCVACWQFVKDFITKNNKRSVWFDLFYCLCICVIRRCISIQKMTHVVKFAFTTTLIDTFFFKGWGGHKQFRYEMYLQPLDVVWRRLSGASKWC